MSLWLVEGFDGGVADFEQRRTVATGSLTTSSARTGATARWYNGTAHYDLWQCPAADEHATFLVHAGLLGNPGFPTIQFRSDNQATLHVYMTANPTTGVVEVRRGDGTLLGDTDSGVVSLGLWHSYSLEVTLSDTVGAVKLRIDGKTPPGWSDLTNVDTKNGGTKTVFDSVRIGVASSSLVYSDDVVLGNGAGTVNNSILADVAVHTLFPNGNGNYSQLTGQDADSTDNYLNVDEVTPDDDTTYNEHATNGNKDTYSFDDLVPTVGTVIGVVASLYAKKSDSGAKSIRALHRRATTDTAGADKTLQTSYDVFDEVYDQDPVAAGAWTIANVNASEWGAEVRA